MQTVATEPSESIQLEMSEDIRLGSPDDASNNLDIDFHMLAISQSGNQQAAASDSFRAESSRRWQMLLEPTNSALQSRFSGPELLDGLQQENTHYSQIVSAILQGQATLWGDSPSTGYPTSTTQSAFSKWTIHSDNHQFQVAVESTSQCLLKYILFSVPYFHSKYRDENSANIRDTDPDGKFRKGILQEELSANHVLEERRRREKLNERSLRSLVPSVTKTDKASILGDTIEYLKHLHKKVQELETEADNKQSRSAYSLNRTSSLKELRNGVTVSKRAQSLSPKPGRHKRQMRIVQGSGSESRPKMVDSMQQEMMVEVSIIESDALLELQCEYREGLLLDIMKMLREELRIEITTVQSCLNNGVVLAEMRAKVKDNVEGKKASITEVKRAINQIIQTF